MQIKLSKIYDLFYGLIDDVDLLNLEEPDATVVIEEYLTHAKAEPYVRQLFSSLSKDDDYITFEMTYAIDEETDIDFVESLISKRMAMQWLWKLKNSKTNVAQFFAEKEQKFYAQSSHMTAVENLYESLKLETDKMITDRGAFYNSYLD